MCPKITKYEFILEKKNLKLKHLNEISTMLTRVARGCSHSFVVFTATGL